VPEDVDARDKRGHDDPIKPHVPEDVDAATKPHGRSPDFAEPGIGPDPLAPRNDDCAAFGFCVKLCEEIRPLQRTCRLIRNSSTVRWK